MQPENVETINLSQNNYIQNNDSTQDRFESRGIDAQSGRGGRYVTMLPNRIVKYEIKY